MLGGEEGMLEMLSEGWEVVRIDGLVGFDLVKRGRGKGKKGKGMRVEGDGVVGLLKEN